MNLPGDHGAPVDARRILHENNSFIPCHSVHGDDQCSAPAHSRPPATLAHRARSAALACCSSSPPRRPPRVATGQQLLRGSLVGVVRGYEYPDALHRLERLGIIRLVVAGNDAINLRKLADGRLDAAMINTDETKRAADLRERSGVRGRVAFASDGGSLPAFVGFRMRHPRGADALARFNAGRRAIAANGTLSTIEHHWKDSIRAAQRRAPSPTATGR